ncbi:MAG TPA: PAS domain-containing protein, partial [Trinickia sp.]|nr:PAS domain-containing protein [Trinickia sp.]
MITTTLPLPPAAETLADMLPHFAQLEPILDALPDVVFFVKDYETRYVLVNRTLAMRCGCKEKRALLGKTAGEVFPSRFGGVYMAQDKMVLAEGGPMIDQLELHLYPGRQPGWCLSSKVPLRNKAGEVVGLAGISRDLNAN